MAENRSGWMRTLVLVLLLAAAGYALWHVREVIVTVLLALVMAYILRPMVDQFCTLRLRWGGREHHLPRATATWMVYVFLALAVWAVWMISAESLQNQVRQLQARWPSYQKTIVQQVSRLEAFRQDLPEPLRKSVDSWGDGLLEMATGALRGGVRATVNNVSLIVELILVPILAFYLLADGRSIRQQTLFFIPRPYLEWTEHALLRSDDAFQRFIRGQVILCLIAFVVVTVGLSALGVDFYLLLGVIAGITRAIPIIGPLVGAIPILIVILLTQPLSVALWVLLAFALLHLLESKLLMPAVLGHELKLHPVLIIVALLIGAQVGGLLGMFLAAPVLAVIRTLIAERREEVAEGVR